MSEAISGAVLGVVPDVAALIRACMGLWLSRGMIDQGMCCSWLLSWSALRSQWLFRSDG